MKSRANAKCAPSHRQIRSLSMKHDMTNVQDAMCAKADMQREHRIVEDCKLEAHARIWIYVWAEIITEMYVRGRERPAKRMADLLHAENSELNEIRETLKDFSACLLFISETSNGNLQKNWIFDSDCVHWMNKCNEGIKCFEKKGDRVTHDY